MYFPSAFADAGYDLGPALKEISPMEYPSKMTLNSFWSGITAVAVMEP
jgi:hypothetical protein